MRGKAGMRTRRQELPCHEQCSVRATAVQGSASRVRRGSPYHALHAMGKQQDNAILPDPLGLPGTDELVDDALSSVVEIPKLGFPKHQGVGTGHGEAQLKS